MYIRPTSHLVYTPSSTLWLVISTPSTTTSVYWVPQQLVVFPNIRRIHNPSLETLTHALHVPPACSTCSFYMFSMFKGHVQHVPSTCSVCSKYMFCMYFLHVLHVLFTCSACSKDMFCMYLLLVQYVILQLHSELQWAITHSNLHRFTRFLFIWVRFIET